MTYSRLAVCAVLGMAFLAFGVGLHRAAQDGPREPGKNWVSVAGFDGEGYLNRYCDIRAAFSPMQRHPAASFVMLPVYALASRTHAAGFPEAAKVVVLAVFAALGALTVWLLWTLTDDFASVAVYLGFAYAWLLAGTAELFSASEAVLLLTLYLVARQRRGWGVWLGMSALAGGITVTNGVKPLLVAAFLRRFGPVDGRRLRRIVLACLAAVGIVIGAACFRWVFVSHVGVWGGIANFWENVREWLPSGMGFLERADVTWQAFFCEPILLHGRIIGVNNFYSGYGSVLPHLLVAAVLAAAAVGAVRGRRDEVVCAALAMASVDMVLHVAVGWGILEGQIYCGHWFFILPLFISRLPGRGWKLALALALAALNLSVAAGVGSW